VKKKNQQLTKAFFLFRSKPVNMQ